MFTRTLMYFKKRVCSVVVVSIKTPAHRAREISPPTDACQFMGALLDRWPVFAQLTSRVAFSSLFLPYGLEIARFNTAEAIQDTF